MADQFSISPPSEENEEVQNALTEPLLREVNHESFSESADRPTSEGAQTQHDDDESPPAPLALEDGTMSAAEPLLVGEEDTRTNMPSFVMTRLAPAVLNFFLPEPREEAGGNGNGGNFDSVRPAGDEEPEEPPSLLDNYLNQSAALLILLIIVPNPDFAKRTILLTWAIVALQASNLMWGYQQEVIMTRKFEPTDRVDDGQFPSAAFCVWTNRLAALIVSSTIIYWRHGLTGTFKKCPLWAFSPCSLSNTLGAFCNYASLQFVPFPVMALFKSCRIVVVIMVGKLLHGTRYARGECIEAILISVGIVIFSLQSRGGGGGGGGSAIFGYLLLLMNLFCDAFTSQWQEKIYQTYGRRNVDLLQMMLGVNIFGLALTSISLVISGDIGIVVEFLDRNPAARKCLAIAALASCLGQLCVFFMIREFGPVVFTIVVTIRKFISILLSSIIFGHGLSVIALFAVLLVFTTVAYEIRRNYILAWQAEVLQT